MHVLRLDFAWRSSSFRDVALQMVECLTRRLDFSSFADIGIDFDVNLKFSNNSDDSGGLGLVF